MSAKFLIVSADMHSGAPPGAYHEYIDPEFRPMLKDLEVENQQFLTRGITQERYSQGQLELGLSVPSPRPESQATGEVTRQPRTHSPGGRGAAALLLNRQSDPHRHERCADRRSADSQGRVCVA